MTPNSITTTSIAAVIAARKSGMRNGSVCPIPPRAVMRPQMNPRVQGRPRPVRLPSSDNASANPMLMPAPMDAASPTTNASRGLCVANAAANTGARVDTEPSINPAKPGWTTCNTNKRRFASSSLRLTSGPSLSCSSSSARSSCERSS